MTVKKGDVYYIAWISIESDLKEKSRVEFQEWHVTTVNKKGIFIKEKCSSTWGKLSKKQFHYGWLPNIAQWVRDYCTKHYRDEEQMNCYFDGKKSKSAAYRAILKEARKYKRDATRILTQVEKAIEKHTKRKVKK